MLPARSSSALGAGGADLHVARAGALQPLEDRREPVAVGIVGEDLAAILHARGERQRLAAGAGAEIEHLLAGLCAGQQRASWLPSSCTSKRPR